MTDQRTGSENLRPAGGPDRGGGGGAMRSGGADRPAEGGRGEGLRAFASAVHSTEPEPSANSGGGQGPNARPEDPNGGRLHSVPRGFALGSARLVLSAKIGEQPLPFRDEVKHPDATLILARRRRVGPLHGA